MVWVIWYCNGAWVRDTVGSGAAVVVVTLGVLVVTVGTGSSVVVVTLVVLVIACMVVVLVIGAKGRLG